MSTKTVVAVDVDYRQRLVVKGQYTSVIVVLYLKKNWMYRNPEELARRDEKDATTHNIIISSSPIKDEMDEAAFSLDSLQSFTRSLGSCNNVCL